MLRGVCGKLSRGNYNMSLWSCGYTWRVKHLLKNNYGKNSGKDRLCDPRRPSDHISGIFHYE